MISPLQALGALAAWEAGWWVRRRARRGTQYRAALARARAIRRPLVVIGAPDGGVTSGYGCGDITIDLQPSRCACSMQLDVTKRLPFPDNSVVCAVFCVLEYVDDADAALREIMRVAGHPAQAFFAGVEPWTGVAYLYPGARRTLPKQFR